MKGVYESVLDDDHDEWLTLSSETRPRFPPNAPAAFNPPSCPACCHLMTVLTGEQLHCSSAAGQQGNWAGNKGLREQYVWICVLLSPALKRTLENSSTNIDPEDPGFKCSFSAPFIQVLSCNLGAIRQAAISHQEQKGFAPTSLDCARSQGWSPSARQQVDDGCWCSYSPGLIKANWGSLW